MKVIIIVKFHRCCLESSCLETSETGPATPLQKIRLENIQNLEAAAEDLLHPIIQCETRSSCQDWLTASVVTSLTCWRILHFKFQDRQMQAQNRSTEATQNITYPERKSNNCSELPLLLSRRCCYIQYRKTLSSTLKLHLNIDRIF